MALFTNDGGENVEDNSTIRMATRVANSILRDSGSESRISKHGDSYRLSPSAIFTGSVASCLRHGMQVAVDNIPETGVIHIITPVSGTEKIIAFAHTLACAQRVCATLERVGVVCAQAVIVRGAKNPLTIEEVRSLY